MTRDWEPQRYERFRDLRLRPALDLLARVPELPPGAVVDLGCGAGAVGPALKERFAGRALFGVDSSAAMLEKADGLDCYDRLQQADAEKWQPEETPALIFSNALLQWIGTHRPLLARLSAMLAPGGVLAVQMPRQQQAPSHRLMGEVWDKLGYPRPTGVLKHVGDPAEYFRLLSPLGQVEAWETSYLQRLSPTEGEGHPVRRFTESTGLRPWLSPLDDVQTARFLAAYDEALESAYPTETDGSVLFPFRRVFFILARG